MTDLADRFQNQPWYIKLWRYRWYLYIPIEAVIGYAWNRGELSFTMCWHISVGSAHIKMNWVYTLDEINWI